MPHSAFTVSVPASSANLGPGFDAVAIALALRMRAAVRPARRFSLVFDGAHRPTHDGLERAFLAALGNGVRPSVSIAVRNDIPLGAGLGSSAALRVLALAIAARLHGNGIERKRLAFAAARLEGHADNAFAAVYGGAVISAASSAIALAPPADLRAVIAVPNVRLATNASRALLPDRYSRDDIAFTAARASLLGAALASGSWHALAEAMRDRIHQPYRAASIPGLDDALRLRMPGLLGVALSGAGPSVLAIARASAARSVARRLVSSFKRHHVAAQDYIMPFSPRGLAIRKGAVSWNIASA